MWQATKLTLALTVNIATRGHAFAFINAYWKKYSTDIFTVIFLLMVAGVLHVHDLIMVIKLHVQALEHLSTCMHVCRRFVVTRISTRPVGFGLRLHWTPLRAQLTESQTKAAQLELQLQQLQAQARSHGLLNIQNNLDCMMFLFKYIMIYDHIYFITDRLVIVACFFPEQATTSVRTFAICFNIL